MSVPCKDVPNACTIHAGERQPSMTALSSIPREAEAAHKSSVVPTGMQRAPHLGGALLFTSASASCSMACASLTLPGSPPPAAATSQCTPATAAFFRYSKQASSILWVPRVHRMGRPEWCGPESKHRGAPGWPPLKTRLRRRPCAYSSTPASTRCRSVVVGVPSLHTTVQHVWALLPQACKALLMAVRHCYGANLRSA